MLTRSDLHDYQSDQAVPHIHNNDRCALWCPVGGGKTVFTLTALDDLSMVEDIWPALVISTKRIARSVWPNEVNDWEHLSHLKVSAICGTADERRAALKAKAHIYTINFENLVWLQETLGSDWPFVTVVMDESTKFKSVRVEQGSRNAAVIRDVALTKVQHRGPHKVRDLNTSKVHRVVELTGTPSPNGLKDLWGQTYYLDAGERLGHSYTAFERRWFRKGYDGYSIEPMPHAEREIQEKLNDICLTVDVPPVDDPIENDIYIDLPPAVRRIYDDMEKQMYAEIDEIGVEAFSAASRTSKCEQIASGALYYDDEHNWKKLHDANIEVVEEIVEGSSGAPVLICYQFRHHLIRLKDAFPKAVVLDDNPETVNRWNRGEIGAMLAHPKSAGHGLNMARGGNILVRAGFSWDLEEYDQILGRIGPRRQKQAGLNRAVFDHRILARRTVDELKRDRVKSKRSVQDILMESAKRRKG